ncbi:unnamed protein product [Brassicogethes aeneus]|uniref:Uncharacterized protein n=1 Tax=Brassicogethes aeneus TaxID=1431903 RepID=A0A9P0B1D4_BRAAE|nr:unnamed protein product [Brassicogethes aeneus]
MNKYGFLLFVALVAAASSAVIKGVTPDEQKEFQGVHKFCQSHPETHIDEELIGKLIKGEFIEDEQLKVHMVCMYQGFKMMHYGLLKDNIRQRWSKHYDGEYLAKLEHCLIEKESPEETAWNFVKCEHGIVGSLYA